MWVLGGQLMSALGMLVGLRLLTEVAAPEVFGAAILATGGVSLIQNLFFLPLAQAALRHFGNSVDSGSLEALHRTYVKCAYRITVVIAVAIVLVGFGISKALTWTVFLGPVLALLLVFESLRGVEINLLNGSRRQRAYGTLLAFDGWLRPIGAFAGALLVPGSVVAILAGQMVGIAFAAMLFVPTIHRNTRMYLWRIPRLSDDEAKLAASLRDFGRPLVPAALVSWISGLADRYIITAIAGVAAAGIYSAGYALVSRPFLMLGATIEGTLRQPLYEAVSRKDSESERKLLRFWRMTVSIIGVIGLAFIILFSDQITGIFLGGNYAASAAVMPWVAAGYTLFALSQVYERTCFAHGATKAVFLIQTGGGAASIGFAAFGVWVAGIIGAAIAVPAYFALQLGLARYFAQETQRKSFHS
jgi:O-antigen/teichoic acid export membrane protein